ncbi:MAG: hypothetical protein ABIN97_01465 [Ginsengibacter sp.]
MRKITSATLIFIMLFNLFGYRFVVDYIQVKNDDNLEARLDDSRFDESQLIELKVPIHLPYQTTWSDFERYDGEVELDGVLYKYVKRKVINDTLVLLCIPNHQKMNLQTAKDEFFKNTTDLAQNKDSKKSDNSKSGAFKKLMSEYDGFLYFFKTASVSNFQTFPPNCLVQNLLSSPHITPEQPPDFTNA